MRRRSSNGGVTRAASVACVAVLAMLSGRLPAEDRVAGVVDYRRDVRPILSDACYACHGPDSGQRQAGLRLDQQEGATAELDSGAIAVVPGDVRRSELVRRVLSDDEFERMPPPDSGKSLTDQQRQLLRRWVQQGAVWKKHWSFEPPAHPALPPLPDSADSSPSPARNPIDVFVQARLRQAALRGASEADRIALIRRVTFDLTGLPPTLSDVDAFLSDTRLDAYERLVDRLLNSPRYGEHKARYWLDAARYGDTHGLHLDNERSLWPYRDWVIRAFNDNMPFDQFTVEQLAGDLLPDSTFAQQVATGFNRCNVTTSEGGAIPEEWRVRYAVDRVETTATVWMGLTAGCAVCHDHKFDPISQDEFYGLFAYFNSLDENPMDGNALLPPPVVKVPTPRQQQREQELLAAVESTQEQIRQAVAEYDYVEPAEAAAAETEDKPKGDGLFDSLSRWARHLTAQKKPSAPEEVVAAAKLPPEQRTAQQQARLRDYFVEHALRPSRPLFEPLHKRLAEQQRQLDALRKAIPATMVMKDLPQRRPAYVLKRGQYDQPDKDRQVQPGVPQVLPDLPPEAPPSRLGLARWLVSRDHPLTARVTVNRIWQQHFGTGIVKTAEDLGSQGEWPSHPQLLDWLAVEFMESGWDVKHMHRLIVTSAAYRQSARVTEAMRARDPQNRLLSRGPRFRLDAETLRDQALAVSGLLVERLGGKSVKPYQPPGLWKAVGYTGSNTVRFERDEGAKLFRRSLYTFWKRTAPPPTMSTFDAPSREACTVRRARTNTPLQALLLMNDEQFFEAARMLAQRMMLDGGETAAERLAFGFRLCTSRPPAESELSVLERALDRFLEEFESDQAAAQQVLQVGIADRDPRLSVPQLAAYTMLANLLLNLDDTLNK